MIEGYLLHSNVPAPSRRGWVGFTKYAMNAWRARQRLHGTGYIQWCFWLLSARDPWPGKAFIHSRSCIQQIVQSRLRVCSIRGPAQCLETIYWRGRARAIWELRARGPCPGTNMKRRSRRSAVAHSVVRCILPSRYSYSVIVALLHSGGGTPYLPKRSKLL